MIRRIAISQSHLDVGQKVDSARCPVSLALRAHVKVSWNVFVGAGDVCFTDCLSKEVRRHIINLPAAANNLQRAFDDGKVCTPIEFEINIPDECLA